MSAFSNCNGPDMGGPGILEIQRQLLVITDAISSLQGRMSNAETEPKLTKHNTDADVNNPQHPVIRAKITTDIAAHNTTFNTTIHSALQEDYKSRDTTVYNDAKTYARSVAGVNEGEGNAVAKAVAQVKSDLGSMYPIVNNIMLRDNITAPAVGAPTPRDVGDYWDLDVGRIRSYDINIKPEVVVNPCTSNTAILGYLYTADSTDPDYDPEDLDATDCKPAIFFGYTKRQGALSGFKCTVMCMKQGMFVIYQKPDTISRVTFQMFQYDGQKNPYADSNVCVGITFYDSNGKPIIGGVTLQVNAINGFSPEDMGNISIGSYRPITGTMLTGIEPFDILPNNKDIDIQIPLALHGKLTDREWEMDFTSDGIEDVPHGILELCGMFEQAYKSDAVINLTYTNNEEYPSQYNFLVTPLQMLKADQLEDEGGKYRYTLWRGYFVITDGFGPGAEMQKVTQMRRVDFECYAYSKVDGTIVAGATFTSRQTNDSDIDKLVFTLSNEAEWTSESWGLNAATPIPMKQLAFARMSEAAEAHSAIFFIAQKGTELNYFRTTKIYEVDGVIYFEALTLKEGIGFSGTITSDALSGGYIQLASSDNQKAVSYSSDNYKDASGRDVAVTSHDALVLGTEEKSTDIKGADRVTMNGRPIAVLDDIGFANWAGSFDYQVNTANLLPPNPPATMTGRVETNIRSYALVGTLASMQLKEYKYNMVAPNVGWYESGRVITPPAHDGLFAFIYYSAATSTIDTHFLNVIEDKMYAFEVPVGGEPGPTTPGNDLGTIPDDHTPLNPNIGMITSIPTNEITPVTPNSAVADGMLVFDKFGTIGYIASIGTDNNASIVTLTNTDMNLPQAYATLASNLRLSPTVGDAQNMFNETDLNAQYATGTLVVGMLLSDVVGTLAVVYQLNTETRDFAALTITTDNSEVTYNDVYSTYLPETQLPLPGEPATWMPMSLFQQMSGDMVKGCLVYDSWFTVGVILDINLVGTPQVQVKGLTHSTEGTSVFATRDFVLPVLSPGDAGTVLESELESKVPSMLTIRRGSFIYDGTGTLCIVTAISDDVAPNRVISYVCVSIDEAPTTLTLKEGVRLNKDDWTVYTHIVITRDVDKAVTIGTHTYPNGTIVFDKYGTIGMLWHTPGDAEADVETVAVTDTEQSAGKVTGVIFDGTIGQVYPDISLSSIELIAGDTHRVAAVCCDVLGNLAVISTLDALYPHQTCTMTKIADASKPDNSTAIISPSSEYKLSTYVDNIDRNIPRSEFIKLSGDWVIGMIVWDREGVEGVVVGINDTANTIDIRTVTTTINYSDAILNAGHVMHDDDDTRVHFGDVYYMWDSDLNGNRMIGPLVPGMKITDRAGNRAVITKYPVDGQGYNTECRIIAVGNKFNYCYLIGEFPSSTFGDSFTLERTAFDATKQVGQIVTGAIGIDKNGTRAVVTIAYDDFDSEPSNLNKVLMRVISVAGSTNAQEVGYTTVKLSETLGGTVAVPISSVTYVDAGASVSLGDIICDNYGKIGIVTSASAFDASEPMVVAPAVTTVMNTSEKNSVANSSVDLTAGIGATGTIASTNVSLSTGKRIDTGTILFDAQGNVGIVTSYDPAAMTEYVKITTAGSQDNQHYALKTMGEPLPKTVAASFDAAVDGFVNKITGVQGDIVVGSLVSDNAGTVGIITGIAGLIASGIVISIDADTNTQDNQHYALRTNGILPASLGGEFTTVKTDFTNKITGVVGDVVIGSMVSDNVGTVGMITNMSGELVTGITISVDTGTDTQDNKHYALLIDATLPVEILGEFTTVKTNFTNKITGVAGDIVVGSLVSDDVGTVGVITNISGNNATSMTISTDTNTDTQDNKHYAYKTSGDPLSTVIYELVDDNMDDFTNQISGVVGDIAIGSLVNDNAGTVGVVTRINSATRVASIRIVSADTNTNTQDNQHYVLKTSGVALPVAIGSDADFNKSEFTNKINGIVGDVVVGSLVNDSAGTVGIAARMTGDIVTVLTISTDTNTDTSDNRHYVQLTTESAALLPKRMGNSMPIDLNYLYNPISQLTGDVVVGSLVSDNDSTIGVIVALSAGVATIMTVAFVTGRNSVCTYATTFNATIHSNVTLPKDQIFNEATQTQGDVIVSSIIIDDDGVMAIVNADNYAGDYTMCMAFILTKKTGGGSYAYISDQSISNTLSPVMGGIVSISATMINPLNGATLDVGTEVVDVMGVRGVLVSLYNGAWTIRTIDNIVTPRNSCGLATVELDTVIGENTVSIPKSELRPFMLGTNNIQVGSMIWDQHGTFAVVFEVEDTTFSVKTVSTSICAVGLLHGKSLAPYGATIDIDLMVDLFESKTGSKDVGMTVYDDTGSGRIGVITMITKDSMGVPIIALVETVYQDRDTVPTETSVGLASVELSGIMHGSKTVYVNELQIITGKYERGMIVVDTSSGATGVVTSVTGTPIPSSVVVTTIHIDKDNEYLVRCNDGITLDGDIDAVFPVLKSNTTLAVPDGGSTNLVTAGTQIYDSKGNLGVIASWSSTEWVVRKIASEDKDTTETSIGITTVPLANLPLEWVYINTGDITIEVGKYEVGMIIFESTTGRIGVVNETFNTPVDSVRVTTTHVDSDTKDNQHYAMQTTGDPFPKQVGATFTAVKTDFYNEVNLTQSDVIVGSLVSDVNGTLAIVQRIENLFVHCFVITADTDTDTQMSVAMVNGDNMIGNVIGLETDIAASDVTMVLGREPIVGTLVHSQNGAAGVITNILSDGMLVIKCTQNRHHAMLFQTDIELNKEIDGEKLNLPLGELHAKLPNMDVVNIHSVLGAFVYDYRGTIGVIESINMGTNTVDVRTMTAISNAFNFGDDTNRNDMFNVQTREISIAHPSFVSMRNGGTLTVGALVLDRNGTLAMVTSLDLDNDMMELETITTNNLPKVWDASSDYRQCVSGNLPTGVDWIIIANGSNPNYAGAATPCKTMVDIHFTAELRSDIPTQVGADNPESHRIRTLEGHLSHKITSDTWYGPHPDADHWNVSGLPPGEYIVATHRDAGGGHNDGWIVYARASSIDAYLESTITLRSGSTFMVPYEGAPSTAVHGLIGDMAINVIQAIPVTSVDIPGSEADIWHHFIIDDIGNVVWEGR